VITIALIAINAIVFMATTGSMSTDSHAVGTLKAHIIVLAGMHPELKMTDDARHLVDSFKADNPSEWDQLSSPNRKLIDGWDAKMRCLKRLNRPEDALKYSRAAAASAVPHLDLENTIQAGHGCAVRGRRGREVSPREPSVVLFPFVRIPFLLQRETRQAASLPH